MKSANTTNFVRVEKNNNFTTINNTVLRDKRLSWKAKGILIYFLQLPDTWIINLEEIIKHSTDGEKAFRSGLDELKKFGYVERKQIREKNRIIGWETIIYEVPLNLDTTLVAYNVDVQNVDVQNVDVQNEGLLSTNNINYLKELNTNKTYMSVDKSTDVKMVINHYKTLKNLPQPKKITSVRESSVNARIKDFGLEEVIDLLTRLNDSEFIAKYHREERKFMSFDWIFSPTKFTKLAEGAYFWMNNKKENNEMELGDIFL